MHLNNVTVEGYEYATPVDDAQIDQVIDLDLGEIPNAKALIGAQFYHNLVDNRVQIVERMNSGNPRYLCSECLTGTNCAFLMSAKARNAYGIGDCPVITRRKMAGQIWDHYDLKSLSYGIMCHNVWYFRYRRRC